MRVLLVLALWTALGFAAAAPARAQVNFDRPGKDYTSFAVRPGDPALCAQRCERDNRCRAWNFRYPSSESPVAWCWLKNGVPPRVEDSCCASGVRGTGVIEPRSRSVEFSTDRPGGDYKTMEMPASPNGAACKAACEGDNKCRAWTYQRPGYNGPNARCFLKNQVKPPRRRYFAISGVVR
jgi:hypothetical protein